MAAISLKARVQGPAVEAGRIGLRDLVHFSRQFQKALERAAYTFAGQKGHSPRSIQQATALEVVGMEPGSFVMALELPREQDSLPGLDLGEQALEALLNGLAGVLGDAVELPPAYDIGVLVAWRDLGQLFKRGIEQISFDLTTRHKTRTYVYDQKVQARVAERIVGPEPNQVVIEGRLLMADFKETGLRCRLHPPAGPAVPCQFDEALTEEVAQALRHYVRVTGVAEKDPVTDEIRLLRIRDVETLDLLKRQESVSVKAVREAVDFWDGATVEELAEIQGVKPLDALSALQGDFWPEDESVDDFLTAIRQWRREDAQM